MQQDCRYVGQVILSFPDCLVKCVGASACLGMTRGQLARMVLNQGAQVKRMCLCLQRQCPYHSMSAVSVGAFLQKEAAHARS